MKTPVRLLLLLSIIGWGHFAKAQLSGAYDINPAVIPSATSFQSLKAAVDTLQKYGVSGPVEFNIASGTYTEMITISAITGASATNTITFQSAANNPDSVMVSYDMLSALSILTLNNTQYLKLKAISVKSIGTFNSGNSNGNCITLTGGASYNTIENCKIFPIRAGIYGTNLTGGNNTVRRNFFFNGYYGVYMTATTSAYTSNNLIEYNSFADAASFAGYFTYSNHLIFRYNKSNSAQGGLYAGTSYGSPEFIGNSIIAWGTNTSIYGMQFSAYGDSLNPALISNNSVQCGNRAMYVTAGTYHRIYHNTLSGGNYGIYVTYTVASYSNNRWRNNIIHHSGTSGNAAFISNTATNNSWDYNSYYSNNGLDLFNTSPTLAGRLSAWQDSNSIVFKPQFVSTTDLHLTGSVCGLRGTPLSEVPVDQDGKFRNNPPVTGAFEYLSGYDISIDALLQPVYPISSGLQNLAVRIRNEGINPVSSFKVSYRLNNATPVTETWTGILAPCDTVTVTFSGSKQLNLSAFNNIVIYSEIPVVTDSNTTNDTLKAPLYASMNGTITIGKNAGPGVDFTSLGDAVAALTLAGVNGPLVFNIKAGTYTEQITIPFIKGASAVNTITFRSADNNPDSVKITFNPSTDLPAIVKLDNSSFIHFKSISVIAQSNAIARCFEFAGDALSDSIENCSLSAAYAGIFGDGITGGNHTFSNNTISNCSYGIYFFGNSSAFLNQVSMDRNTFINPVSYGIFTGSVSNSRCRGNTITADAGSGIRFNSGSSNIEISGNLIKVRGTSSSVYGMYLLSIVSDSLNPALIFNNSIVSGRTGIYNRGAYQYFYNNSISSASVGLNISYTATSSYNKWINNMIYHSGTTGTAMTVSNTGVNNTWDYNLYFTKGSTLFNTYVNLSAWQTAKGQDLNSKQVLPPFTNDSTLQIRGAICDKTGIFTSYVTKDIEGNTRNNPPLMGAYEPLSINNLGVQALTQPSFPVSTGLQDITVRIKNEGINTISSFGISYVLNGGSPVSRTWTGTLLPCDTLSITFGGTLQANIGAYNRLDVYTYNPNGIIDNDKSNDTLKVPAFGPPLNGVYTIGNNAADFPSFKAAVNALMAGGVTGPVVFNVQTGVYNEGVNIPSIKGSSANNTITFQSLAQQADSVLLQYYIPTNSMNDSGVITMADVNYIRIKRLTIAQLNPAYGMSLSAIVLKGSSSYDSISYCKFTSSGIWATVFTGKRNVFTHNRFTNAARGITIYGVSAANTNDSNSIMHNTFDQVSAPVSTSYTYALRVIGNKITGVTNNGIFTSYSVGGLEIIGNVINIKASAGLIAVGLRLAYTNYQVPDSIVKTAKIINNSIISAGYGIDNRFGFRQNFYHNSISSDYETLVDYDVNFSSQPVNQVWKNNIIASKTGDFALFSCYGITLDYNVYSSTAGFLIRIDDPCAQTATSLTAWRAVSGGKDFNSFNTKPYFIDDLSDLHLLGSSCNKRGDTIGVLIDADGNPRSTMPFIGAYDMPFTTNLTIGKITQPTPPLTTGAQDVMVQVKNTGSNVITSFDIAYTLNNAYPISQSWAGILNPCDSVWITFTGGNQVSLGAHADTLKVFTSNPNFTADGNPIDDTVSLYIGTALAGTYTVGGPTADFASISEAVRALTLRGISDSVIFNVTAGMSFREDPVILNQIPGNNLYAITFHKNGSGSNPVIYGKNGSITSSVVTLTGVNHVTFDGIDVADTSGAMVSGFSILGASPSAGSSYNTIRNSNITMNSNGTTNIATGIKQSYYLSVAGVATRTSSGSNNNNRYENIKVNKACGFLLEGVDGFPDENCVIQSTGNDTTVISNADIIGNGGAIFGIQLTRQKNALVQNCIVRDITTDRDGMGIYLSYVSGTINGNKIYNIRSNNNLGGSSQFQLFGIRADGVLSSGDATVNITGNVIYGLSGVNPGGPSGTTGYMHIMGMSHGYNNNSNLYGNYFNNSVYINVENAPNVNSCAFWKGGASDMANLRNNILINNTGDQSGTPKHYVIYKKERAPVLFPLTDHSSNNIYWIRGANGYIACSGDGGSFTNYTTLNDWKAFDQSDNYSVVYFPKLSFLQELKPDIADSSAWVLNGRGEHLNPAIINTDANRVPRPSSYAEGVPDIGAYEFTPSSSSVAPLAKAIPESINSVPLTDTTQVFVFLADTVAKITWKAGSAISKLNVRQYAGIMPWGATVADNSMFFYADINAPSSSAYSYDLDLYYRKNWAGTNPDIQNVRIAQRNSGAWNVVGLGSLPDTTRGILNAPSLTTFSQYTGTDQINPLPVSLILFSGKRIQDNIQLTWTTASEARNNGFEILRSDDGKQFKSLAFIKGKGNSVTKHNYVYNDVNAFRNTNTSTLYYRLKQSDHNGLSDYSDIISIHNEAESPVLSAYPNPFSDEIVLMVPSAGTGNAKIEIFNMTGTEVFNSGYALSKGSNKLILQDIKAMPDGLYYMTITIDGGKQTLKLLKQ